MWQMILAGRFVLAPLVLCSVVGLAVFIERLFVLRRSRVVVPEIAEAVETLAATTDYAVANAILQRRPGPFANIVRAGLDHAADDWQIIKDALQESGRQEAKRLNRHLNILETIAAIGPLLGLLGTVTGMIRTFADVSRAGIGNPQELSGGLSEAMIATAAGLIVGIPALVAHNWLAGRADGLVFDLEVYAGKVLETLRRRRSEV
jgi:biopolymer transport protein ExbB